MRFRFRRQLQSDLERIGDLTAELNALAQAKQSAGEQLAAEGARAKEMESALKAKVGTAAAALDRQREELRELLDGLQARAQPRSSRLRVAIRSRLARAETTARPAERRGGKESASARSKADPAEALPVPTAPPAGEAGEDVEEALASERARAQRKEGELRSELAKAKKANDRLKVELDKHLAELERIKSSEAFRFGHFVVRLLRAPMHTLRGLWLRRRLAKVSTPQRKLEANGGRAKPTLTIPEARDFLGSMNEGHSTTLLLVWGLSEPQLESLADEIARLQMMLRSFKPLFVTDSPHWAPFMKHGLWFEYVPSVEEWMDHNEAEDWLAYVDERISSIISTYSPERIVVYEDAGKREALKRGVLNQIIGNGQPPIEKAQIIAREPPPP